MRSARRRAREYALQGLYQWQLAGTAAAITTGVPALGAALIVLGALFLLGCGWNFAARGLGTPAPFDPPKKLVITGPYRWVRNPIFSWMILTAAGLAPTQAGPAFDGLKFQHKRHEF